MDEFGRFWCVRATPGLLLYLHGKHTDTKPVHRHGSAVVHGLPGAIGLAERVGVFLQGPGVRQRAGGKSDGDKATSHTETWARGCRRFFRLLLHMELLIVPCQYGGIWNMCPTVAQGWIGRRQGRGANEVAALWGCESGIVKTRLVHEILLRLERLQKHDQIFNLYTFKIISPLTWG